MHRIKMIYCRYSLTCLMTAMEELDGDTVRLSSRGRYAERDIVQVRQLSINLRVFSFVKDTDT